MATITDLTKAQLGVGGIVPSRGQSSKLVNKSVTNTGVNSAQIASQSIPNVQQNVSDAISEYSNRNPASSNIQQSVSDAISDYSNRNPASPFKEDPVASWFSGSDLFSDISNTSEDASKIRYKVRLVSVIGLANAFSPGDINSVIFEATPGFTESGTVEYSQVQPVHMPGSIQTYKFTHARTFNITAHLISRNTADALKNMKYLQTLRSWRYPFFGNSGTTNATRKPAASSVGQFNGASPESRIKNSTSDTNSELLGAPPEVLYLYAYSTSANDKRSFETDSRVNINRVPVVLSSLQITYPEDVDYLPISITPTSKTEPFPVKMDVQLTLLEAHSPTEYERFDLMSYKTGTLVHF